MTGANYKEDFPEACPHMMVGSATSALLVAPGGLACTRKCKLNHKMQRTGQDTIPMIWLFWFWGYGCADDFSTFSCFMHLQQTKRRSWF